MAFQGKNRPASPTAAAADPITAWGPFGADGIVAAQLAISSLVAFYPKSISRDGKLQPESLFSITGALAGYAAQYAVRREMADAGGIDAHAALASQVPGSPIDPAAHSDRVVIAQAPNGERHYFSDRIDRLLMPGSLESMSAYSVLGGQAMRLGATKSEMPDCFAILERTVRTMGATDFGAFRGPAAHIPAISARRAIEIFWPATLKAFTREPVKPAPGFKLLPPRFWPVALAMVASTYMEMVKGGLTPALALAIFMEAAIPMSKIDQDAVHFV